MADNNNLPWMQDKSWPQNKSWLQDNKYREPKEPKEPLLLRKARDWDRSVKGRSRVLLIQLIDIVVRAITCTHDQAALQMLEEERDELRRDNKRLREELRKLKSL